MYLYYNELFTERVELADAATADQLALEQGHFFVAAAEAAVGNILLQNDLFAFDEDFQTVASADTEGFTQFLGKNDSSELVDGTNDTGGFHVKYLSYFICWPPGGADCKYIVTFCRVVVKIFCQFLIHFSLFDGKRK